MDGQNEISVAFSRIESKIDNISRRLDALESSVRVPGTNMGVGEITAANRRSLVRSFHLISTKADADEMKEWMDEFSKSTSDRHDEFKASLDSKIGETETFNDSIAAIDSRICVLSSDLANKVDNSSFTTFAADARSVRNHSTFVKRTEERTSALEHEVKGLAKSLSSKDFAMKSLEDHVRVLKDEMENRAIKSDLECIGNVVKGLSTEVQGKADARALQKTDTSHRFAFQKIAAIEKESKGLVSAHERLAVYVTKRIEEAAKTSDVDAGLRRMGEELRIQLESRACKDQTTNIQRMVESLLADYERTKKKADLAARFIEWYGSQGTAYEHNLKAIDNQLKDMASNARLKNTGHHHLHGHQRRG